jgi:hypothetical protein
VNEHSQAPDERGFLPFLASQAETGDLHAQSLVQNCIQVSKQNGPSRCCTSWALHAQIQETKQPECGCKHAAPGVQANVLHGNAPPGARATYSSVFTLSFGHACTSPPERDGALMDTMTPEPGETWVVGWGRCWDGPEVAAL